MPNSEASEVALRHRAGSLDLDVAFTLDAPWTTLFAPSGAGKSTILRMIAGLENPAAGRILLAGQPRLLALNTEHGRAVPPHRRGVLLVAQRPALFPHRSVIENVKYGMHPLQIQDDLERILNLCRVPLHLRDEKPARLSGGERQRVALARTIGRGGGRLLMLDEPFTGLESDLRDEIIHDLRGWAVERKTPILHVTHDIGEVFSAEAHVLKMANGRIVASGPAEDILAEERERLIERLGARRKLGLES